MYMELSQSVIQIFSLHPPPPHPHIRSHNQARNLIQQGKSRGQVTLVVATRGHVPSLSQGEWNGDNVAVGGGASSDGRNRMKDIPDGVVLRKKKKSTLP